MCKMLSTRRSALRHSLTPHTYVRYHIPFSPFPYISAFIGHKKGWSFAEKSAFSKMIVVVLLCTPAQQCVCCYPVVTRLINNSIKDNLCRDDLLLWDCYWLYSGDRFISTRINLNWHSYELHTNTIYSQRPDFCQVVIFISDGKLETFVSQLTVNLSHSLLIWFKN